jgi:hypothetical protein
MYRITTGIQGYRSLRLCVLPGDTPLAVAFHCIRLSLQKDEQQCCGLR